jgi:hypothetical protein
MIVAALLLAAPAPGAEHCAEAAWCPPIAVIENAVRQREVDDAAQATRDLNVRPSHAYITIEPSTISRFSGIWCDAPLGDVQTITCQATAHYEGGGHSDHMFRMVRTPEGWKLGTGGLAVLHAD